MEKKQKNFSRVYQLFPEPVYFSKLERPLTNKEVKIIGRYKEKTHRGVGNITSDDTYVLENKALKNLKEDLNERVLDYFNEVVCTSNLVTPYITQSWINYTGINQFHHRHHHANSYVSGVFYIDVKKGTDKLNFYRPATSSIRLEVAKHNAFNVEGLQYSVENGDVVLFPSFLEHGVAIKKEPNTRISLSFNVFLSGIIGNEKSLSKLKV